MTAAFHGNKKYGMGSYTRTAEEEEARLWCMENDIIITPRQAKWREPIWHIDIEKGKYPNRKLLGSTPEVYGRVRIWEKVAEYQLYYYNKYGK